MTPDALILVSQLREMLERNQPVGVAEQWAAIVTLLLDHMATTERDLADEIARELQTARLTGAWSGAHRGWTYTRIDKEQLQALAASQEASGSESP